MGFYLIYPFLLLDSLLPWSLIYLRSSIFYFFIYYIIGYRKKVVLSNLRNAFPEKTEKERILIAKQFYAHFCDLIFETIKLISCSRNSVLKRCVISPETRELTRSLHAQGKSVIWVMGHCGNWEMASASVAGLEGYQVNCLYLPLSNRGFDHLMYRIRSRFGTRPVAVKDTYREFVRNRNILTGTVFLGDQTPSPESAYWTRFLNQDTPVYKGAEVMSRKMNLAVVYVWIQKVRRGHYLIKTELITTDPASLRENELTERHTRLLERDINTQPFNWLWSHRRWKHRRPENISC
ncbi:MAG: lysophospholipid acyltransferase family protein [Bacteroidia bacterium]|nr:lysophospholipid acyltransferase family protein [Bacteroidia bacterium]